MEEILNISPIDGRYAELTKDVKDYFSEYHLIKNRLIVEINWLKRIFEIKEFDIKYSKEEIENLDSIIKNFNIEETKRVKEIEKITNHDVKAIEYYIDEKLKEVGIEKYCNYVHFACTSEDINNLAYGIMEKQLLEEVFIPNADKLISLLKLKSKEYSSISMLSHTHGQNATPTTVGKEFSIFVYRLERILDKIKKVKLTGKFNGTVGNFNAHLIAFPDVDWIKVSKEFVESFGLECNLYTTQIESHDSICLAFSYIKLFNNILLDLDSDMWMYISRNYFIQENISGEVGSSVMPHKINPIKFENSMANVRMANSILNGLIDNLEISRMQRDLSDSSMLRNIGVAFSYSIISIKQTIDGLNRLSVNKEFLLEELQNNPEVLAEAIQTILRKNGYSNAYEILKKLTRGRNISEEEIESFVENLEIDSKDKQVLLILKPQNYIGLAKYLAENI